MLILSFCLGSSVDPHLAEELQSRELTVDDYQTLLRLDELNQQQDLYAYLSSSLPPPINPSLGICHICSLSLSSGTVCMLPCYHQVHTSCVMDQLRQDVAIRCTMDGMPIFPGLAPPLGRRDKKKSKKKSKKGKTKKNKNIRM